LEFGGKPTASGIPTVFIEKNINEPLTYNPKVTEATTFKTESEFPF
jgi:hypothetical protein